jgi:activator of HSP90 ATPase
MEVSAPKASMPIPQWISRRQAMTIGALAVAGLAARAQQPAAAATAEILMSEEGIHQVRVFAAERKRVYAALTVEQQFDRIVQLSGVMKTGAMAKMQIPTQLSPHEGGVFTLFGGHIVGTQLALVPDELIVQAWRVADWPRGAYSIARFELSDQGKSTRLVFDHQAFPKGSAEHLASGWQEHYWDPLTKLLS